MTTSSDRRRMTIDPRTASQANADDIRVDSIAAQLEEAEQHRLTDDWLRRAGARTTPTFGMATAKDEAANG